MTHESASFVRRRMLSRFLLLTCIAVLASCALRGAQAFAAEWGIEEQSLAKLGLSEASVVSSKGPLTLETTVIGVKVKITCELAKSTGRVLVVKKDEATIELSKCSTTLNGTASPACKPKEPVTVKVSSELREGETKLIFDNLKPTTGTIFVEYLLSEECAIGTKLAIKGETAAELESGMAVAKTLKFSEAIAKAAGTSLTTTASQPAYFNGSLVTELSGANAGKKWGYCTPCNLYSFSSTEGYGASNPAEPNVIRSFEGSGINLGSGDLFQAQNDLSTSGRGPTLELTRYYNSQLAASAKSPGIFGYGWTSTFSATLTINEAAETATVRNDNGSTVVFYLVAGAYKAAPWVQAKLAKEGVSYVYTLPSQTKLFFNSSGQLVNVTDRHGNAITLAYNGKGLLETATDSAGRKLTLTYNVNGQVESVKDPMGHLSKYTYESNNLATVTLPEEKLRWKFGYDASHQLTTLTDGRSHSTTFEYDASNRVKLEKDALEHKRSIEYPSGTEAKVTEPNTSTTVAVFNSALEPTAVTLASGTAIAAKTTSEYDSSFNLKKVTDPNTHSTEYTYDGEGNRTSEKDGNGNETKWTYNGTHDVLTVTTPKNETTTFTRNASGDPETIKRPAPEAKTQETKLTWAANGDLEEETDPLSHKTIFKYDKYGDEESETDPETDKTTRTYNENGQVVSEVSPRGNEVGKTPSEYETKIKRDAQGRPEVVTDPLGKETKYKFDGNGNLEVLTNPNGHATTYVYNAIDQRTEVKAANGDISKVAYDSEGDVESTTDGNNHTTKYEHNLLDELTKTTDPLKRETTRTYDAAGNLKELKDAKGRTTTYTYDAGDRLEKIDYSDVGTPDITYKYGKDGEVTEMTDGTGTSKNTYDELDRMTESKNGNAEVVKYEYDLGDEITKITYPNEKAVTRKFDTAGRLESAKDWLGNETKFSYNRDSMPTATTFPATSEDKDEYAYDRAGRIEKTTMKKGAATLASLTYARTGSGQLESLTQTGLPGAEKPTYGYDEKERMTSGAGSTFKYDSANSPIEVAGTTQKFDEASELKEAGSTKYAYDEVGERVEAKPGTGPVTKYGFDQAGNLTSVSKEGSIEDTYAYDGNGLRSSQKISGVKSQLTWDGVSGEVPLLLYDGTNYYLYGPDGTPIEQIAGTTVAYLHHDQQGSTRLLTNSLGEAKGKYTYTPYGAVEEFVGSTSTPLGFDGQYRNESTGLIYLRARAYDPKTAQFLTVDPLVDNTGEPYGYAGQSPANNGDPSGLCWCQGGNQSQPPLSPGQSLLQWFDSLSYAMGGYPPGVPPPPTQVPPSVYPPFISDPNYFWTPLPPRPPQPPPDERGPSWGPIFSDGRLVIPPNMEPNPEAVSRLLFPGRGVLGGYRIIGGHFDHFDLWLEGNVHIDDFHRPIQSMHGYIGFGVEFPLPFYRPRIFR
jgi:RHS repeat-associated protein